MKDMSRSPQYDRAWGVLLGASLCMFCGLPSVLYYTFGLFTPEIIAKTGWSATAVAASIGPAALVAAPFGPVIGRLTDRLGVRPVALVGGPAFGFGVGLLGMASHSVKSFSALLVLAYVLAIAGTPIPYAQALTGWFDKRRGLALGIMFCTGAAGIAIWPIYANGLIVHFGWRHAYMAMGASAGSVIFLSALFLLRNAPSPAEKKSASDHGTIPGLLVGAAVRTARFWKIAMVFLLLSAVLGGTAVEFPVVLRHEGADAQTAAAMMSLIGIFMFVGRLLLGFILDRWFAPVVTIMIVAVSSLSLILLMTTTEKVGLSIAAAILGFGIGTEYAVAAYMTSRAFGFRSYGIIYGLIVLATGIGLGLGPASIGVALNTNVSTRLIFGLAIALLSATIGILATLKKQDFSFVGGVGL